MDNFTLKMFFCELIKFAFVHPGTIGNPCSQLVEKMCLRQDGFLNRIMGDYTGRSHEFRLNNAGLKMYWSVDRNGEKSRFTCRIGGDQTRDYPFFVAAANELIKEYEYDNANGARTLMRSRVAFLFRYDVDALDNNVHQAIRPNVLEDAEVKRLYHIYKSL